VRDGKRPFIKHRTTIWMGGGGKNIRSRFKSRTLHIIAVDKGDWERINKYENSSMKKGIAKTIRRKMKKGKNISLWYVDRDRERHQHNTKQP
jgi:hypothetical protein